MLSYFKVINHTQVAREQGLYYEIQVEHRLKYQRYLQWIHKRKLPNIYRISQDEFKRALNYLMQGLPVYIQGYQVEPLHISPEQEKFRDFKEFVEDSVETWEELPEVYHKIRDKYASRNKNLPEKILRRRAWEFVQNTIAKKGKAYAEDRKLKFLGDLELRNQCYKNIMYLAMKLHIKAYSPCARTYFEVKSRIDFEDSIPDESDITDEQIAYIECNARKYGLDIPTTEYCYATREAFNREYDENGDVTNVVSHGFTDEIYRVIHTRPSYNESHYGVKSKRSVKDIRRAMSVNNLPEESFVYDMGTTSGQYKELYEKIKWFESLDPETRDFFIADGYCRCPHCGEITRKVNNHNVDIRCEYCDGLLEELICVSNDHLLYGTDIDNAYSDLSDVQNYIDDHQYDDEEDEYDD